MSGAGTKMPHPCHTEDKNLISRSFRDIKALRLAQAVEGAHFFSQPIFIPLVYREEFFSLAGDAPAQVSECQTGGNPPDADEFMDAVCHGV